MSVFARKLDNMTDVKSSTKLVGGSEQATQRGNAGDRPYREVIILPLVLSKMLAEDVGGGSSKYKSM